MTTTAERIEVVVDEVVQEHDEETEPKLLPDPTVAGLIWALSLGAGRMPLFP